MNQELLLCELLECGTADLIVINGCEYDISDIINEAKGFGEKVTLASIVNAISNLAKNEICSVINDKLDEISSEIVRLDNDDSEIINQLNEIEVKLKSLNQFDDFELWFNFLDTHVSLVSNEDIYKFYLKDEMEKIFEDSGLTLLTN